MWQSEANVVAREAGDRPVRRNYQRAELKKLFALSYNECALPGCEERLANPDWPRVLARVCHIYGLKPGAARHVPGMSEAELNAYENLLLLCPNCHDKVDHLYVAEYPAERLLDIKRSHEERRGAQAKWCSDVQLAFYVHKLMMTLRLVLPDEAGHPEHIRLYELSHELGVDVATTAELAGRLGMETLPNAGSTSLPDEQADMIRDAFYGSDSDGLED